jgi:hypothetical protein
LGLTLDQELVVILDRHAAGYGWYLDSRSMAGAASYSNSARG